MAIRHKLSRRSLLRQGSAALLASPLFAQASAFVRADRPLANAVMSGDLVYQGAEGCAAVIWARADRSSRMQVTWRTSERGERRTMAGPYCTETTDFTGRMQIDDLPPGQTILYEVQFQGLDSAHSLSEPVRGRLLTAPASARDIKFLWSGDQVGQGWGINPDKGGMRIFDTMLRAQPDFFLHSGDTIYADGPLEREVKLPDGVVWRNIVTEEKSKVAETLDEYRGQYRYNLLDENFRSFIAGVTQVWQWDDHETMNNWSSSKSVLDDPHYREKNVPLMVSRASCAFQEYAPLRPSSTATDRVYRTVHYGPLLDVFVLDMRSYRGPNTWNRQESEGPETVYFGTEQLAWLQDSLKRSRAVWKAVACDMPLGVLVPDGKDTEGRVRFENSANGDGPPLGRELEIARLLKFIKQEKIRNTVWFTADVHYTAAHYFNPAKAQFTDFHPFWEFVSGPLNAGCFGPNPPDDTFGLEVMYQKAPPPGQSNLGPSTGMQFFGEVEISARTQAMTVTLRDLAGTALHRQELAPERT
jgi:alkaline phosphatase D